MKANETIIASDARRKLIRFKRLFFIVIIPVIYLSKYKLMITFRKNFILVYQRIPLPLYLYIVK
jgi:hypothetical protein